MLLTASGCAGYGFYVGYGLYRPPEPGAPQIVAVTVHERGIDPWPRQVRKGRVAFELVNEGALAHALVLVGPGAQQRVGEELAAGEQQRAVLDLKVGTYKLFCPDGNHAREGMTAWLEVEDDVGWFRR